MAKEKVLIIGGGFAGVKAALELAGDERFSVTLVTPDTDLRYYPTLYHVATGGKRANASIPLVQLFADKAIKVVQTSAEKLDRQAKMKA